MQHTQRITIGILLAVVLGGYALLMPMHGLAQSPDPEPDAALREAIKDYIESQGRDYAGLCREIEQWQHHGEDCAFVLSIENGVARVSYGAVASDGLSEVTFVQREGAWFAGDAPEPTPELPVVYPEGLEDAIREFLEERGLTYAGLCKEIDQSQHYGEYCAFINEVKDGKADVSYGIVASDGLEHESFFLDETGWHATSSGPIVPPDYETPTPADPTPEKPVEEPTDDDSGSEDKDSDDNIGAFILAIAGATVLAGGAGAYGLRRRHS